MSSILFKILVTDGGHPPAASFTLVFQTAVMDFTLFLESNLFSLIKTCFQNSKNSPVAVWYCYYLFYLVNNT